MSLAYIILLLLEFVTAIRCAIELRQEVVSYENMLYIILEYFVMHCLWFQFCYHIR